MIDTHIIHELPVLYRATGTENLHYPLFPLFLLLILGLAIERLVAFIRISRSIRRESAAKEKSESKMYHWRLRLESLLSKHLLWFVVIALFCLLRIWLRLFYGVYEIGYVYGLMGGEVDFLLLSIGLREVGADLVFITLQFFVSMLCFLVFHLWKGRLISRYWLRSMETSGIEP
ncbi:hypothetical protein E3J62_04135 [candidate division TA06 bacterium]|uniref:Uncharacterized protein n=1 Tax=candidate division TA06 bacterium TaxID=2250710 RepID=A0A523UV85_UNCT6|nr:MAG: hypothetical protein E3J62_04135 [candidate division TA06 bacterium]